MTPMAGNKYNFNYYSHTHQGVFWGGGYKNIVSFFFKCKFSLRGCDGLSLSACLNIGPPSRHTFWCAYEGISSHL